MFTARYGLIPYIKQVMFRLLKFRDPSYFKKLVAYNKNKFLKPNVVFKIILKDVSKNL